MATRFQSRATSASRNLITPVAATWALRLAAGIAAVSVAVAVADPGKAQQPALAGANASSHNVVWLDQGWTDDQRRIFHNQSQGTLSFPIPTSWFMALQQPEYKATGLFSDPTYLEQFGFIPSPADPVLNPNGLPVGFAQTVGTNPV